MHNLGHSARRIVETKTMDEVTFSLVSLPKSKRGSRGLQATSYAVWRVGNDGLPCFARRFYKTRAALPNAIILGTMQSLIRKFGGDGNGICNGSQLAR